MKEKLNQVLYQIKKDIFELDGKVSNETLDNLNRDSILQFTYELCELQKQECYSAYRLETNLSNTNKAILNCKNVCDEDGC